MLTFAEIMIYPVDKHLLRQRIGTVYKIVKPVWPLRGFGEIAFHDRSLKLIVVKLEQARSRNQGPVPPPCGVLRGCSRV